MVSQDFCDFVHKKMSSVPDEEVKKYQAKINNPFISDYIKMKNDEAKIKLDKLKVREEIGYKIHEDIKIMGDLVFDNISSRYKGKVILMDFWATWCGACLMGIERMKSLKEEFTNGDIVFVYITNLSSPREKYDKLIADIKGEHLRLSSDEWNVISDKFKISGIPHYVLVGKDGFVINPDLPQMSNEQLRNLLLKYINE